MTDSHIPQGLISQQHMPQTSSPNALRWRVGLTPATERNVRHWSFSDWKCYRELIFGTDVQAPSVGSLRPSRHENTENGRIRRGTQEAPCGCRSRPPTAVQGELAGAPLQSLGRAPFTTQKCPLAAGLLPGCVTRLRCPGPAWGRCSTRGLR